MIESAKDNINSFDKNLKGLLSVAPPKKEDKR
jgi:hypothetical protein